MGIESDDDRLDLLADHETVIWTPTGGSAKTVPGVFDREYLSTEFGDTDIDTRQPMVLCRSCDIETAAQGDSVEYDSTTYTVVGVEPDGQGMTMLVLADDG